MEATKERVDLLDKILPPALADAGLEDCALPAESIHEAFRKAANAVKSRAASFFENEEEEGGCVTEGNETIPSHGASDTVIVGGGNDEKTGPCLAGKGNAKLADLGRGGNDLVMAGEGGEGKSCGDGLKDVDVEGIESSKEKNEESEEDEKKPILVEGFV